MANHCNNEITITGNQDQLTKIQSLFPNENATVDFKPIFGKQLSLGEKDIHVGTKCFTTHTELENDTLYINGDSDWSPPLELFQYLSEKFPSLRITIVYREPGCDIGGEVIYENGIKETLYEGCYWGLEKHIDKTYFLQKLWENLIDWHDTLEETMNDRRTKLIDEEDRDNFFEQIELEIARQKITTELFNKIEPGDKIKLTDNYVFYRYWEDDVYVIVHQPEWEEIYQILTDGEKFVFYELI